MILEVVTRDKQTGISVIIRFSILPYLPVLRITVTVVNTGENYVTLLAVPSLTFGGLLLSSPRLWEDWHVHYAHNAWFREIQLQEISFSDVGLDYMGVSESSRANLFVLNQGSFFTRGHLPMGGLSHVDGKASYSWQIEHNGSWRWEIGDYAESLYLSAGGPIDQDHA